MVTLLNFKDVGKKVYQQQNVYTGSSSPLPIGIKTPVSFGENGEGIFSMHFDIAEQIQDNLKNLILTNHGERVCQYTFGANLRELVTEFSSKENFDQECMIRINTAVSQYMPFVSLNFFDSLPYYVNNIYTGKIKITVIYSVPDLNIFERSLGVMLFVI